MPIAHPQCAQSVTLLVSLALRFQGKKKYSWKQWIFLHGVNRLKFRMREKISIIPNLNVLQFWTDPLCQLLHTFR